MVLYSPRRVNEIAAVNSGLVAEVEQVVGSGGKFNSALN